MQIGDGHEVGASVVVASVPYAITAMHPYVRPNVRPPLRFPLATYYSVQQAINELPADRVIGGREGIKSAAQALRHIGSGPSYKRVGEMVLFDCWNTHVNAIFNGEALIRPGQLVMGYAAELAARFRCSSVNEFCSDFGISFPQLARGDDQELHAFAALTGNDVEHLRMFWSIYKPDGTFQLGHAVLTKHVVTRSTVRGLLPSVTITNPKTRSPKRVYVGDEMKDFATNYVSLTSAARSNKIQARDLRVKIDRLKIKAVFDERYGSRIYRRQDLSAAGFAV